MGRSLRQLLLPVLLLGPGLQWDARPQLTWVMDEGTPGLPGEQTEMKWGWRRTGTAGQRCATLMHGPGEEQGTQHPEPPAPGSREHPEDSSTFLVTVNGRRGMAGKGAAHPAQGRPPAGHIPVGASIVLGTMPAESRAEPGAPITKAPVTTASRKGWKDRPKCE